MEDMKRKQTYVHTSEQHAEALTKEDGMKLESEAVNLTSSLSWMPFKRSEQAERQICLVNSFGTPVLIL